MQRSFSVRAIVITVAAAAAVSLSSAGVAFADSGAPTGTPLPAATVTPVVPPTHGTDNTPWG